MTAMIHVNVAGECFEKAFPVFLAIPHIEIKMIVIHDNSSILTLGLFSEKFPREWDGKVLSPTFVNDATSGAPTILDWGAPVGVFE